MTKPSYEEAELKKLAETVLDKYRLEEVYSRPDQIDAAWRKRRLAGLCNESGARLLHHFQRHGRECGRTSEQPLLTGWKSLSERISRNLLLLCRKALSRRTLGN
jgi:hypothetical protein